jgi:hypothetical protein
LNADRAPQLKASVMLLPLEQFCGSRFDYKLLHAFVRLTCLVTAAFIIMIFNAQHLTNVILQNDRVADVTVQWFLYYSVPVILSVAVFESFWLRRTEREFRPLAIDWFFVLGYLIVLGFGVVEAFLHVPIF